MQIDIDYLKMILDKFVESETQYIETSIFHKIMEDEKFLFHWDILLDKRIIVYLQGNLGNFYSRTNNNNNNNNIFNYINVRLNDNGYNFYEVLKDNKFRNKIKKDFKNISIETLGLVAKKFLDNKIDKFL
ncbi:hypothetical protein ACOTVV_07855 [Aliarcobacter butzleri]